MSETTTRSRRVPGIPTPADVRRGLGKVVGTGLTWPIERQVRAMGRRGTITRPEVLAFRAMSEAFLARPAFRADAETRTERVRTTYGGRPVRGEWVERAASTRTTSVLLYVHGGAFVAFSPRTHRGLVSELAARSGLSVFSVDYRLAPEHVFPAAADDVLRAYAWLLDSGVPAERIVVAGDSAGGHLALGLAPRAVRAGLPAPAGVLALSPVVDASMRWSRACELRLRPDADPVTAEAGIAAIGSYTRGTPLEDPELLLTEDELSVVPPVLLQVSEHEMLLDDATRYVDAVRAAGGSAELQSWPHKPHVFQIGWRVSATASAALDRAAEFLAEHAAG